MITNTDTDKPLARLLVVDDEPDIVEVFKLGLLGYGFLVDAFTNSEQALISFKSDAESYCLVVPDIRMPSLCGIQLARSIKEANPNVNVLLLTGFEIRDNEFSKVFPSTSVDGFIQKPIVIRKLDDKILSLICENEGRPAIKG
jgi:DNA-binding response OmpR family regulator